MDGNFLHLATALDPQWEDLKVNNKSGREGSWCKLRAEIDLLKGEEDVARDKVDAHKFPSTNIVTCIVTLLYIETAQRLTIHFKEVL